MRLDKQSETWGVVKAWAEERRAEAVEALSKETASHDTSMVNRGVIKNCDKLLSLGEDQKPKKQAEEPDTGTDYGLMTE